MKFYVTDPRSKQKIYIDFKAASRLELLQLIGGRVFILHGQVYNINDIKAESSDNNTISNAVVGGLIGLLGGPIGVLAGGLFGGLIGNDNDQTESRKVETFNNTKV